MIVFLLSPNHSVYGSSAGVFRGDYLWLDVLEGYVILRKIWKEFVENMNGVLKVSIFLLIVVQEWKNFGVDQKPVLSAQLSSENRRRLLLLLGSSHFVSLEFLND